MDHKARIKKAIENYSQKLVRPKREKNKKPEKAVEKQCVTWMRAAGWDVQVYEAKATFNPRLGRYQGSSMKAGTVDCQGVLPSGVFIAVEFKAPGRLNTFNQEKNFRQKQYLIDKINHNAFGCVTDSVEKLKEIYEKWILLSSSEDKKKYLLEQLP